MSLHIIIDGYNFIRNSSALRNLDLQDIQLGRDTLVDMLAAYKRIKSHKITVVFDGTNAPGHSLRRDRIKGIDIKFSRPGELADTVIKKMASREKEKALVVSSDREVVRSAASHEAATISSPEFEEKLALAGHMQAKGIEYETDDSGWTRTTKKKGPRKRLPKKMRRNRLKTGKL